MVGYYRVRTYREYHHVIEDNLTFSKHSKTWSPSSAIYINAIPGRSCRKSVTGRVYTVYCNISREKRESVYFYYIFSILYTVSEKSYSILYSVYCILLVYYLYTVSSILYTVSSILYCIP